MFTAGDRVLGKYQVLRPIGMGGMAFVFKALHLELGHEVALKVLRPAALANRELVERFRREGRVMASVCSPYVLRVFDVESLSDGTPIIASELLRGRDLLKELRARGEFPIEEAVDHMAQACEGALAVHQAGLVHRDLKPQNLFLTTAEDGTPRIKILDFGICKMLVPDDELSTGTLVALGTPSYMSPEQIRSSKHTDPRTDIWSLGVILFELLTKRSPFEAKSSNDMLRAILATAPLSVRSLRPDVPEALDAVLLRALDKDPARRWPSAEAFRDALLPFTSQEEKSRTRTDSVAPIELSDEASLATYQKAGLLLHWTAQDCAHDDEATRLLSADAPTRARSDFETREQNTRAWPPAQAAHLHRPSRPSFVVIATAALATAAAVALTRTGHVEPVTRHRSAPPPAGVVTATSASEGPTTDKAIALRSLAAPAPPVPDAAPKARADRGEAQTEQPSPSSAGPKRGRRGGLHPSRPKPPLRHQRDPTLERAPSPPAQPIHL